ncbi:hypothetical protein Q5424_21990 [Conexibacter sp. JD483]|uniref:hypothetical protein n=1 Tax=unclassified Conexibacter TaxID=2627773 RepID=UPI002727F650|nr:MULTISPECIES: hypothetical protein [unclassified Conexibacter]MDO8186176.1 hypothetical protein [Conexibacter sp. CPCC 205706]MDO8199666.1 hypothetical protein [Conexibacter sp. CPCC 205762]MDR9371784.1 hypothetical protein [Conexibacter sp. JD483]
MESSLAPYAIGMALGFTVGVFGHVIKSRTLIASGIGIIFVVAVLLPLLRVGDPG